MSGKSRGFTLVELMVTVGIIAMLAAAMLGAVHVSREAARKQKTQATILKIHDVVMAQYDSYRTRRMEVFSDSAEPKELAPLRLVAVRDIIRMEMPERWADVVMNPVAETSPGGPPIPRPARSRTYLRRYEMARARMDAAYGLGLDRGEGQERLNRYGSAECLYMIVGRNPILHTDGGELASGGGELARFHDNEVGDADGDGLYEFHDGWGNPIMFLRWAPGLVGSPLQKQVFFDADDDKLYERNAAAAEKAAAVDHDLFDSRNVQGSAYRLVPYIYSAGPDGIYDVNFEPGYQFTQQRDPYSFGPVGSPEPNEAGIPVNSWNVSVTAMDPPEDPADLLHGPKRTPDSLDNFDNIDNHTLLGAQ